MALCITPELRDSGPVQIRRAGRLDKDALCATLAAAFLDGPLADWVLPDRGARAEVYLAHSRAGYDHAIAHGLVHTTNDHLAAAIWYPYSDGKDAATQSDATPPRGRLAVLEEILAAHEPAEPHDQLAFIGVHPAHQKRGLGGRLLEHHHRGLDATGRAAFLVATSQGSRDLYGRHGYRVRQRITLPDGPDLWAMWRDSR